MRTCQSFRDNCGNLSRIGTQVGHLMYKLYCTLMHDCMFSCLYGHMHIYSHILNPCSLRLTLPLPLWWHVVDELGADIIGTGPVWHCSADPQK